MGKIPDGCILLARKLLESEIWSTKPAWWLKVWIYLIMEVNFADTRKYKRGQGFFRMAKIYEDCHLYNDNIKVQSLTNLFQWLKKMTQVKTQKMTRGIVITICNYEEYQEILHYKNDTVNETDTQDEMRQKRVRNDTIIDKNANKNAKEKDINTLAQKFDRFWAVYPKKKSKGRARKAFYRINPSEPLLAKMLATIERAKTSEDWMKEKGKYILYPETWLNAEGWEDEIITLDDIRKEKEEREQRQIEESRQRMKEKYGDEV